MNDKPEPWRPPLQDPKAEIIAQMQDAMAKLETARATVSEEQLKALTNDLVRNTKRELTRLAEQADDWWRWKRVTALGVALLLIAGAYMLGSDRGYRTGVDEIHKEVIHVQGDLFAGIQGLTPHQAYVWSRLIRNNQDIDLHRKDCEEESGRTACLYALWQTDAPPPKP